MRHFKKDYSIDDIHQLVTYYMFNDNLYSLLVKNDLEHLKQILEDIYIAYTVIDVHNFISFQEYSSNFNDLVREISTLLSNEDVRQKLNNALKEDNDESI